jgi:uncharacterized coiled-coil protein SlyX
VVDLPMSAIKSVEERLVGLELVVTHVERDLGALNSVVLEQQREIDALKRMLGRLDDRVTRLADEDEPRDAAGERPPHY